MQDETILVELPEPLRPGWMVNLAAIPTTDARLVDLVPYMGPAGISECDVHQLRVGRLTIWWSTTGMSWCSVREMMAHHPRACPLVRAGEYVILTVGNSLVASIDRLMVGFVFRSDGPGELG